jgi:hypothetical protein
MSDMIWYALIITAAALLLALVCYVNIRLQRARLVEEAKLTPEELRRQRAEEKVFQGVFRRRP